MIIELAQGKDKQKIAKLDSHIPSPRLGECIWNGQVYVLKDDSIKNGGHQNESINGHIKRLNPLFVIVYTLVIWSITKWKQ